MTDHACKYCGVDFKGGAYDDPESTEQRKARMVKRLGRGKDPESLTTRMSSLIRRLRDLKHWSLECVPASDCYCYGTNEGPHCCCGFIDAMVAKQGGSFVRRKELERILRDFEE